jgi:hypothetical protein
MKKIIVLIALVLLVIIAALIPSLLKNRTTMGPDQVIITFFDDIASESFTTAYDKTSEDFQANTSIEVIQQFRATEPVMQTYIGTEVTEKSITDTTATITGTITGDQGQIFINAALTLTDKNWLIDTISFNYSDDLEDLEIEISPEELENILNQQ